MSPENCDVLVIGGGAAGMAAALEARSTGVEKVVLIERGPELGGILQQCIHNGFGSLVFKQDLPGPAYAQKYIDRFTDSGIQVFTDTMLMELQPGFTAVITGRATGYTEIKASSVVLATGCRERTRAQIMLPGSHPAGVFTAGTMQRFVNIDGWMPGKKIVILGSGDIGMIMARRLALEGAEVVCVLEALPFLTGLRRNFVQCLQDFNIPLELSTTVKRITGERRVSGVETVKLDESMQPVAGTEKMIPCDTLLLSVGLIPENEIALKAGIMLDSLTGGPVLDQNMSTEIPGLFCAGNSVFIQDLVDHVTFSGRTAGRNAALYVLGKMRGAVKQVSLKPGKNVRSLFPPKLTLPVSQGTLVQARSGQWFEGKVVITLRKENVIIKTLKKNYARPAEMIELPCGPIEDLSGELTLDIIPQGGS